jgi:hypothetical protein
MICSVGKRRSLSLNALLRNSLPLLLVEKRRLTSSPS